MLTLVLFAQHKKNVRLLLKQGAMNHTVELLKNELVKKSRPFPVLFRLYGKELEEYAVRLMVCHSGNVTSPVNAKDRELIKINTVGCDQIEVDYVLNEIKKSMPGAPYYKHIKSTDGRIRIQILGEIFTSPLSVSI